MVRRIVVIVSVSTVVAAVATSALARSGVSQATDPSADSPAGVIYSIPLDRARQDAAPHRHPSSSSHSTTGAVGGGSGSGGGSAGANTAAGGASQGGSGSAATSATSSSGHPLPTGAGGPVLVPGGQPGSLVHSANGFGSSSQVPGLGAPASSGLGSIQSNSSSAPVLAILLALLILATGVLAGRRAWR